MKLLASLVFVIVLTGSASAQATAYSVSVFNGNVTNPATGTPVRPAVVYPLAQVSCNLTPKATETLPIVDPNEGRFDDPANPTTRDCSIALDVQMRALPAGTIYRAAVRTVTGSTLSAWSPLSSIFTVTAAPQAHPCDGATLSTAAVIEGTRTLTICNDGKDVNGSVVQITGWAIYVDGVRSVLASVTAGTTANAAGLRDYSVSLPLTRGTKVIQIVALNAQGEAAKSTTLTVTVSAPLGVPSVSLIKGLS